MTKAAMKKTDYLKVLRDARAEYATLIERRVELERRILHLEQTIAGLAALCGGSDEKRRSNGNTPVLSGLTKLTSATRQVLAEADSSMNPPELRDALLERGVNVTHYANPLAVIHNTLIRLKRQGEATQVSGAWALTDKGRLALKIDLLDVSTARQKSKAGRRLL